MAPMIEELVPDVVASAEAFGDPPDATLFPVEEALIATAVDKRRREVTTARHLARSALATLGFAPAPIPRGERGAPVWPAGVVGSMTHTAGYRCAVVAHDRDVHSIGVDAEEHAPVPDGVLDAVSDADERRELARLAAVAPDVHWDRLLFSAKESVYKTWFPLTRRWLDFAEAAVTPRLDGTFTARLLVPGPVVAGRPVGGFEGRWLARDGLLLTAIALPVRPPRG
jgi:4'-phosphopantetheinyl transferase EntD